MCAFNGCRNTAINEDNIVFIVDIVTITPPDGGLVGREGD